jgi:rifampicin phosphotransferase
MNSAFIINLGSGAAGRRGVGNKGKLLDQAARAGLPVPRGVIVLDTVADLAVLHGAAEQIGGRLQVVDPPRLVSLLQLPPLVSPVAVRSAFKSEDTEISSLAGYFRTVLNVDLSDAGALGRAIEIVWDSAKNPDPTDTGSFVPDQPRIRRDIIIMEMVTAERSGVAFTEREYEDDLVNYTSGTAEGLLGGTEAGESLNLPKLRGWEKAAQPRNLPSWAARLQALLRDVRRWIGNRDWDIEWADDGKICWLVQLRPITRPTRRDETFSIANHKEILPSLPSPFMTSVVESCAYDLYGYYREFDPSLPQGRPFLEIFYGRPYINLSLMAETMRHWGLPTRLVTDNIGGAADQNYGMNFGRVMVKTLRFNLPRQAFAQMISPRRARLAVAQIQPHVDPSTSTLTAWIEEARRLYVALVRHMFALLAASGPIVSVLAQAGVLAELNAHHETVSTRKFRAQEAMRAYAAAHPEIRAVLHAGEVPDDKGFRALWGDYLREYGHRGPYESDLSRPRDAEQPGPLLRSLSNPPLEPLSKPKPGLKALVLSPLWWQASRVIAAREQWRHEVMRGFAAVRAGLLQSAAPYVESGALPDIDHLWLLRVDEVHLLEQGWIPDNSFWQDRYAEVDRLAAINPPDMIRRFQPLLETASINHNGALHGIPLTRGEVAGRAWVLHEPAYALPEGFDRRDTILVARSVDVGWVGTFSLVSGVAVETGGHLSHGSIVLREIGLPAITNAAGATRFVTTGDRITLNAERGIVLKTPITAENSLDTPSSQ